MEFISTYARRLSACAIPLAALIASPAEAKKAPEPPYQYGPAPDWARYKELAEEAIRAKLLDPESARFEWPSGYKADGFKTSIAPKKRGYVSCGHVNARNGFGGYVGRRQFAVIIDNDAVIDAVVEQSEWSTIPDACKRLGLPPAAQMTSASTGAGTRPSGFGFAITKSVDGARVATVDPGSPAEAAGLKPGVTIVQLNGVTLTGLDDPVIHQLLGATTGRGRFTLDDGRTVEIEKSARTTARANPS